MSPKAILDILHETFNLLAPKDLNHLALQYFDNEHIPETLLDTYLFILDRTCICSW